MTVINNQDVILLWISRRNLFIMKIKREVQRILVHECRCNESLKDKDETSTRLTYTGFRGGLDRIKKGEIRG